jgi:3-hydroxyisobutyrate dehydrogenase
MQHVAFFGLGVMGGGMARRLLGAGFPLTVWNRHPEPVRALQEAGATAAASPREAAAGADVLLAMVADDGASRAVWTGADGALADAKPGAVVVECSTISPAWAVELAGLAAARGCAALDAPVTGSKPHAADGQVLFLVGGDAASLDRARPVLEPMSRDIVHLGPAGSGARMKLVNNFLCGVQAASLAEALAFVEASGLDREAALAVLLNGAPGSPLVKTLAPRMAARDYAVNFMLAHMTKDLAYAAAEAGAHGVPLATAETARQLFEKAAAAGWGQADFSAVVEAVRAGHRHSRA